MGKIAKINKNLITQEKLDNNSSKTEETISHKYFPTLRSEIHCQDFFILFIWDIQKISHIKRNKITERWWLTLVIVAPWEAEITAL
jgi:hypothetical protein